MQLATACRSAEPPVYDLVIYGATSAGIVAAVQARRMGASVIVLAPSARIGGLTTGGLGQTDIGNKEAIGGISREFYQRIRAHYANDANWRWETKESYRSGGQSLTSANEDTMWTFEPSAALKVMQTFVSEQNIEVVRNARLDRTPLAEHATRVTGVVMHKKMIQAIVTEDQTTYRARCFIDATYEGDLMAGAGVSYVVGRESSQLYDESLNGVQTKRALHHQLLSGVDPYRIPGDPTSGLLPGIDKAGPGVEQAADHRVQAFCFRMCLTDHPSNRLKIIKPAHYDPLDYELLFRNFEAGAQVLPWSCSLMPNRKTDINNNRGVSTDFIGESYRYPEANYEQRDAIVAKHLHYQQGLLWTLANHPRVPQSMRKQVSQWGPCRDEFSSPNGWQRQLYIREARRMTGATVMTQNHCQGSLVAKQPVGLAAYTMDSHHVQRYVDANGQVQNEGDVQVGGFSPYGIEYASLTPQSTECVNLLVPVCLSASHIAFGSIRMEPVFMVLGQTAATAAIHSIRERRTVQTIDYDKLRSQLLHDKQVLSWSKRKSLSPLSRDPNTFSGHVLDEDQSVRMGFDSISQSNGPFLGSHYRHDSNAGKGLQTATYSFNIKTDGKYELQIAWTPHSNRATNVPIRISTATGKRTFMLNQRQKPNRPPFGTVSILDLAAGVVTVEIGNTATDGYVILDGTRIVASASGSSTR
ncbi:MAG: FAD-dependent oxidoreductase [Pirellulaceae bacterium]|nr:FAD-dependent oxidoreductase [Pirellulaceae bacterium]